MINAIPCLRQKMINAIPCLRQKMINAIPCLRQKSQKTYPGWPHVPTKPLWGSTPPPRVETASTKKNYIFNTTQCNWPSDMHSASILPSLVKLPALLPIFYSIFGPFYLFFLTSMKQSSCLISVWSFKMMQDKVFPLSLAAHKTHIELTNKCYVAQIYGFH